MAKTKRSSKRPPGRPPDPRNRKTASFKFPCELLARLRAMSIVTEAEQTEILNEALREHLSKRAKELPKGDRDLLARLAKKYEKGRS